MPSPIDENINNLWHHARTLKSCHDLQRFLTNLPNTKVKDDISRLVENVINDPTWSAILLCNQNHNGQSEVTLTSSYSHENDGPNNVLPNTPGRTVLAAKERIGFLPDGQKVKYV